MQKSLLKSAFHHFGYSICKVRPAGTAASVAADGGAVRLMPLIHADSPYHDFLLAD